ncbi:MULTISPECIES: hypothetical protein [unclassified Phyllobacterium]|uniref:hypothetical protein n=1 Tax=unclassified Phyllobacterium TaxID=2638441 RepID=UPI003012B619
MPKKQLKRDHPADIAARNQVKAAMSFSVHLRRGPDFKINEPAATLAEAITIADRLSKEHANKTPLIYAITQENFTILVPKDMIAAARDNRTASSAKQTPIIPANASKHTVGQRAAILADAEKGILPPVPDFRAPTHARFRKKLEEVVRLVEARDIETLRKLVIKPTSTSPRAIAKYIELAILALASQK